MPSAVLKPGERKEVVSFRLQQNTIKLLNKIAERRGKSALVDRLIREEAARVKKRG